MCLCAGKDFFFLSCVCVQVKISFAHLVCVYRQIFLLTILCLCAGNDFFCLSCVCVQTKIYFAYLVFVYRQIFLLPILCLCAGKGLNPPGAGVDVQCNGCAANAISAQIYSPCYQKNIISTGEDGTFIKSHICKTILSESWKINTDF